MKKTTIILLVLFAIVLSGAMVAVWTVLPGLLDVAGRPKVNNNGLGQAVSGGYEGDDSGITDGQNIPGPARVSSPQPQSMVGSPFTVSGEVAGSWFKDGGFPVYILDGTGKKLAAGFASAQGIYTPADYVTFQAGLEYRPPTTEDGMLVLENANSTDGRDEGGIFMVPILFRATTALAGEECLADSDCRLPGEFALRSSCPYEARCMYKKCTVVCPEGF